MHFQYIMYQGYKVPPPPWHRAKFEGIVRCPVSGKKVTEPPIFDTKHRTPDIGHRDIGHRTLGTRH